MSESLDISNFQIKQDDKFFKRLMSRDSSMANHSFRAYYGGATASIPFKWESQPGTPRHAITETSLPPLTPPPSFYPKQNFQKPTKKHSPGSKLISLMFPRPCSIKIKQVVSSPSPSSSSSPSSPSWSSSSSFMMIDPASRYQTGTRLYSFDLGADYEQERESTDSPTSNPCFGISRRNSQKGYARGSY